MAIRFLLGINIAAAAGSGTEARKEELKFYRVYIIMCLPIFLAGWDTNTLRAEKMRRVEPR